MLFSLGTREAFHEPRRANHGRTFGIVGVQRNRIEKHSVMLAFEALTLLNAARRRPASQPLDGGALAHWHLFRRTWCFMRRVRVAAKSTVVQTEEAAFDTRFRQQHVRHELVEERADIGTVLRWWQRKRWPAEWPAEIRGKGGRERWPGFGFTQTHQGHGELWVCVVKLPERQRNRMQTTFSVAEARALSAPQNAHQPTDESQQYEAYKHSKQDDTRAKASPAEAS